MVSGSGTGYGTINLWNFMLKSSIWPQVNNMVHEISLPGVTKRLLRSVSRT